MKTLLALATLLFSNSIWASQVLGTWQGHMIYDSSDGTTGKCTAINTFSVEGETLTFNQKLGGDCEFEMTLAMTLKGNEIWQNDMKIGEFAGDTYLQVTGFMIDESTDYSFSMNVVDPEATQAQFSDTTMYINDSYTDSITGDMARVER